MNKRLSLCISLLGLAFASVTAQHYANPASASLVKEEADRLSSEGHYFGSQLLAESLINAYYLNEPGTEERIAEWVVNHPVTPQTERLLFMRANLLVREGRYAEAAAIYAACDDTHLSESEATEAKLYQAIAAIHTNNLDDALGLLHTIQSAESHQTDVNYYLGYVYYARQAFDRATEYFEEVSESYDYRSKVPVYLADCYVQQGKDQQALEKLKVRKLEVKKLKGGGNATEEAILALEAQRVEGEALYGLGNYAEAASVLQAYADEDPAPKRTALYKLGMSRFHTKDFKAAAESLTACADKGTDAMAQNAWLHVGMAYLQTDNKQQARMSFQRAAEMKEDAVVREEALYNYALILHDGTTMGFGESVNVMEEFLNTFPQSRYQETISRHLTEVYFTTKNYPAALASINKIDNPSTEILTAKQRVLYNLGIQQFTNGDFNSAKDYMQQSITVGEAITVKEGVKKGAKELKEEAYYWKGESEYRLGDYTAAINDLRQYLSTGRTMNQTLAQYSLGYSLFKQKNYSAAQPYFLQCVATAGNDRKQLISDTYNRIGDCQLVARKYDEAYQSYQRAIDTDRVNGDYSLLQQALISGLRGNYGKKVELLAQLGKDYQQSDYAADALFEQGRAYVQSGDRTKAADTYNQLISQFPQSSYARKAINEIALVEAENGQPEAAIATYQRVLDNYPNTPEAQTALANMKDLYTDLGRINEYAQIAKKAGKALTPQEFDNMTMDAAQKATSDGKFLQALTYYQQLEAQTQSPETRLTAQIGILHSAAAAKNQQLVIEAATKLLQDGSKAAPEVQAEARLLRAQTNMQQGNSNEAVADYQLLVQDTRTVYGAQAAVELAHYAYATQQYQSAEDVLTHFIDTGTSHTYWLARAFVLLSDVYAATDRSIEARQYLLSLKSNYTASDDITKMIDERLEKLNN